MRKVWLVAARELRTRLRQRGFLITTLALPVIVVIAAFVGNLGGTEEADLANEIAEGLGEVKQGFVDQAGVVDAFPDEIPGDHFISYNNPAAANEALRAGDISAYYLIPAHYVQTGEVERVSVEIPTSPPDNSALEWLLLYNLAKEAGFDRPALLRQPLGGQPVRFVNLTGGEQVRNPSGSPLPMFAAVIIMVPLFVNGGLLFQSLAKEKEGRVMEILLASLRPLDLLAGKILGVTGLMLLQYTAWAAFALLGYLFAGDQWGSMLTGLSIENSEILLAAAFTAAGFLLYAGLMAGVGALAPDSEGSRAWLFVITLPMSIPIYLGATLARAPNSPMAVGLSLFPPSAPVTMLIRLTGSSVPGWQVAVSLALLLISVVLVLLIMARLFRAQTLLSGESLSIRRLVDSLRST